MQRRNKTKEATQPLINHIWQEKVQASAMDKIETDNLPLESIFGTKKAPTIRSIHSWGKVLKLRVHPTWFFVLFGFPILYSVIRDYYGYAYSEFAVFFTFLIPFGTFIILGIALAIIDRNSLSFNRRDNFCWTSRRQNIPPEKQIFLSDIRAVTVLTINEERPVHLLVLVLNDDYRRDAEVSRDKNLRRVTRLAYRISGFLGVDIIPEEVYLGRAAPKKHPSSAKPAGEHHLCSFFRMGGVPTLRAAYVKGEKLEVRAHPRYYKLVIYMAINGIIAGSILLVYKRTFFFPPCCAFFILLWLGMAAVRLDSMNITLDLKKGAAKSFMYIYKGEHRNYFIEMRRFFKRVTPDKEIALADIRQIRVTKTRMRFPDSRTKLKNKTVHEIQLLTNDNCFADYVISQDTDADRAYELANRLAEFLNVAVVDEEI